MKKVTLIPIVISLSGALMVSAALAQNTDMDRQDNISKEYRKAMEAEREARQRGASQPGPNAREQNDNIDSPDNIGKEHRKAMEDEREAKRRQAEGIQGESEDHLDQRRHMDSQDNINKEYRKTREREQR